MVHEGGCLCGAVRFKAQGDPANVRVCHCRLCQRAQSAPFYARAFYTPDKIVVTGETDAFQTSPNLDRVFCPQCGTRLFSWRRNGSGAGIALAAFDDRNAFAPTEHIWVSEKMAWLKLNDELPQYAEGPPP
jgi:hypothetical protein